MGNPSIGHVIEKLRLDPAYRLAFEAVFPGRGLSAETLGQAIAAYERTVVSGESRFDRWRYRGEAGALSEREHRKAIGCSSARRVAPPATRWGKGTRCSPTSGFTTPA